jgi:hypothetical protein
VTTAALSLCASVAFAQPPADSHGSSDSDGSAVAVDASTAVDTGTTEWMVTAGPAWGFVVLSSARGYRYLMQTVSWGRILADPRGPGALRGRFEWAVEVAPIYRQYEPSNTNGVAITPFVWRWNFQPRGRLAPYGEFAGGGLWTANPVPDRTTTLNFTAHAALGMRIFLRSNEAAVLSYRVHHISNGNRLPRNPGVNAHMIQVGWVLALPRK